MDQLGLLVRLAEVALHADLEREAAAYVEVTMLDVTACKDPELLADRIQERSSKSSGAYSDIALEWQDIRSSSITGARDNYY